MKKRLLSLTLSILMILALVPAAVFAVDNEASIGEVVYATLADAITAAEDGETIKILKDVDLGEQIIVEKSITIDLDGNTITANADDGAFRFNTGADGFALKNGTIESGRSAYITNELIIVYDAGGTFEDLTIDSTNYQYGVTATTDGDEDVMLVDCAYAIECTNVKVTGPANLFYTDYIPMTLTDCEASQSGSAAKDWHNCAISASWGATVTVESGTYSGKYVLNENSSPAKIVVNGGEFTGEIKDWGLGASYTAYGIHEWEINGGAFTDLVNAAAHAKSGATIKVADDIVLNDQIILEKPITIDLGGNTITANADDGAFRFNTGADGFALKNGNIESGRGAYITNELIIVYDAGGTFEDLTIDSTNYQYGVTATTDGDEDVMLADCAYAIECTNVKVTGPANLFYTDYIPMTLTDCEASQSGSAAKDWHNCAISASWGATVTVESGTYSGKYVLNENSSPAKIVVNGGEFTGEIKDWGLGASYTAYGSHEWEISGGYFTVDPADYLADGYESITSDKSGYDYKVGIESTITFVTNGGGTIDAITGEYDTDITMPDDPEKTGYTFAGWFTNEALTAEFADTKFGKEDVTLYAKWAAENYTITFECNGGTPVDPISGDYGTDITMPEAPAKEGFEFVGWFTDSKFAGEAFAETTFSADVTLYAKWEAAAGTEVVTETIEGETAVNADNLTITGSATEDEIKDSAATVVTDVVATDSLKDAADAILAEATETEAKVEEIKAKLEDAGIDTTVTEDDGVTTSSAIIVVYAVAGVSVEPISYEETSADEVTTTYEITPTVTLVASTAQNASEIVMEGAGVNAVEIAAAQPVEVTDTVTISVKLPAMFASKTVYVSHKGSVVAAEANAEGDITFDAEGMSPFTFSLTDPTAAKIGSASYETLEAAIAAANAGDVIVLTKNCSESDLSVPNMDLTISCGAFTLDASALTSEATMTVNGENGVDQEIVFAYKETPDGNPGGSPSSGRPSSGRPSVQPVEPAPVEPVEPVPAAKKFKDVSETAYYAKAVDWAVANGITSGTGEDTFSPEAKCTRAQIMTFLWIANGKADAAATGKFADVSASSYYSKAVAWAVENGITSGLNATTFGSETGCTRAQVMTFLWIAAGKPEANGPAKFGDVPTDSYYAKAVAWAVEQGVTSGTGLGTFSPEAVCTRAQIVTFLYGVYGK